MRHQGSPAVRRPGRRGRITAAVVTMLLGAGCVSTEERDARSEVEDTFDQAVNVASRHYLAPASGWTEENQDLPERTRDAYEKPAAVLPSRADVYEVAARDRLYDIEREGDVVVLTPRYPPGDLTALGPQDEARLAETASQVAGERAVRIQVVGHASSAPLGGAALDRYGTNQALSEARARVVADALRARLGDRIERLDVKGLGSTEPVSIVDVPRNRRVEVRFSHAVKATGFEDVDVPEDFEPWWHAAIVAPLRSDSRPIYRDMESLMLMGLESSRQIEVFRDIPLIRETAILEAEGRFDPRLFMESRLRTTDEPVGSTLKTGGPERFYEKELAQVFGIRKQTFSGAEVEASQKISGLDNNSRFFVPEDQGLTRLSVSLTQPLLNRGGVTYNRSTVRVAQLDHGIALDELQRQVESHLLEIARAYWSLYLERGTLLIKTRLADRTARLVESMEARRSLDALESQIVQGRAALSARRADSIRAGSAVRNAEARLAALVNAPELSLSEQFELVPSALPIVERRVVDTREAASHALQNRPEIRQAMKQLRAGMIRLRMSENELLPVLDFLIGVEWDGLEDRYDFGQALSTQFSDGGPSFNTGLIVEIPIGNRIGRARHERRRLEVRQLTNQLRTTVETLLLEVQVSVREVSTAHRELGARYQAMIAAGRALEEVGARGVLAGGGAPRAEILDDLLDAQERLGDAEQAFIGSTVTYNVAIMNLDRALGVLMEAREIEVRERNGDDGLPTLELVRP